MESAWVGRQFAPQVLRCYDVILLAWIDSLTPGRWVGSSKHFLEEEKFRKRGLA